MCVFVRFTHIAFVTGLHRPSSPVTTFFGDFPAGCKCNLRRLRLYLTGKLRLNPFLLLASYTKSVFGNRRLNRFLGIFLPDINVIYSIVTSEQTFLDVNIEYQNYGMACVLFIRL